MDIFPAKRIKVTEIEGKGRGVVATEKILKGEIIERFPLLVLGEKDVAFVQHKENSDVIYHYYLHQKELKRDCLLLGFGSMYNHNDKNPNAEIDYDDNRPEVQEAYYRAIKDIEPGEEITWDYEFENGVVEFMSSK